MRNTYRVPKKTWNKWNRTARKVFNETFHAMRHNADVLFPPKAQVMPETTMKIVAWNSAWIAADAANTN